MYSLSVSLSFRFTQPLLEFSHWFLIHNLAFMRHTLRVFPPLNFATIFSLPTCVLHLLQSLFLCVETNYYSFLCKPWLQLNEEVNNFGYFTINGTAVLFCWGKLSGSKCKCVVWFGTWKFLRNVTVCGAKTIRFGLPHCICACDHYTQIILLPTLK